MKKTALFLTILIFLANPSFSYSLKGLTELPLIFWDNLPGTYSIHRFAKQASHRVPMVSRFALSSLGEELIYEVQNCYLPRDKIGTLYFETKRKFDYAIVVCPLPYVSGHYKRIEFKNFLNNCKVLQKSLRSKIFSKLFHSERFSNSNFLEPPKLKNQSVELFLNSIGIFSVTEKSVSQICKTKNEEFVLGINSPEILNSFTYIEINEKIYLVCVKWQYFSEKDILELATLVGEIVNGLE